MKIRIYICIYSSHFKQQQQQKFVFAINKINPFVRCVILKQLYRCMCILYLYFYNPIQHIHMKHFSLKLQQRLWLHIQLKEENENSLK